jgi:hypothetical protein
MKPLAGSFSVSTGEPRECDDSCTPPAVACAALFVRNRQAQSTQPIRPVAGSDPLVASPVGRPAITDDGRFIAVEWTPPIVCHCDNTVSVSDRQADTWAGISERRGPSISGDGRFLVMTLFSAVFFEGPDVILYDRIANTVTSVSHGAPTKSNWWHVWGHQQGRPLRGLGHGA